MPISNSVCVKTILILAAIPHSLRLDKEIRSIEEAIRRATKRDLFKITLRTAVRPTDIRRAIAEEQPQIVHFCGHGLEDGSLVLENDSLENKPVPASAIASLFQLHVDYVECVLLNACHSAKPAVAISEYIDCAIGMNQPIGHEAAIAFVTGFYDGLGYPTLNNQNAYQRAFNEGKVAIQLGHLSEEKIPVIKTKTKTKTKEKPCEPMDLMTNPSLDRKKRKITYTASPQGIEKAENALRRLGFESKRNFANSQLLSPSTVTKFFQRQPIQLDSLKRICNALELKWREVAGIIEEESERLEIKDCSTPDIKEGVDLVQTLRRKVTVTSEQSQTIIAIITLEGDLHSVPNRKIFESILKEYSGNSIKILDVKEGSIKLIIEGYQEDIQRLLSLRELGELTQVNGFPVEDIQIVDESSNDDENAELDRKWCLVQEIVSQPVEGRDLSGADLSDADLSGADLSDADLSDADLSNADLSDANLRRANLSGANLSGAILSNTKFINLIEALKAAREIQSEFLRAYVLRALAKKLPSELLPEALKAAREIQSEFLRTSALRALAEKLPLDNDSLSLKSVSCANLNQATLINANLSQADLRYGNFRGAYLNRANLSRAFLNLADLSDTRLINTNLSSANLRDANLIRANLIGSDLKNANLIGANLIDADLSGANVEKARFGNNQGISEPIKLDLLRRGAIFVGEPPPQESRVLVPA